MDMVSEKIQIRKGCFFIRTEVQEGEGMFQQQEGDKKALNLEMALVDYLDETGVLIMKLDQVSE